MDRKLPNQECFMKLLIFTFFLSALIFVGSNSLATSRYSYDLQQFHAILEGEAVAADFGH